jgi:KipI family sensor histidine kinase inhibitor
VNSTTLNAPAVNVRYAGTGALLIEVADPLAWDADLRRRRAAGEFEAADIVPGAGTVLLDGVPDPRALGTRLAALPPPPPVTRGTGRQVDIPVTFDGADLSRVADLWECSTGGVVTLLTDTTFTVAFCGFAPGFGYLTGLPGELAVPRLDRPRARVPAGSVGLAGPYAAVYPTASPGGWLLVGRTEVPLFDVDADPPALLTPGTTVRFTS